MTDYKVDNNSLIFQTAVKKLGLRFPIADISEKVGYNKGDISSFLKGRKPVSDNFLKKLAILNNEIVKKDTAGSVSITADFYSLKHTFLDYLDANVKIIDFNSAQSIASHTTSAITHGVYTVGKKKRENEILKQILI